MYPKIDCELEYSEAYKKTLGNKNIVVDANIGHLKPRFTILNGSLGKVEFKNKELRIKQELMYEDNG
jgi:muramoyltetrapeptide carboxypeptidase LdcA involved in peptidoglycan recycling